MLNVLLDYSSANTIGEFIETIKYYCNSEEAFEKKRREDLFVSYPDINKIVSEVSELMDYVAS